MLRRAASVQRAHGPVAARRGARYAVLALLVGAGVVVTGALLGRTGETGSGVVAAPPSVADTAPADPAAGGTRASSTPLVGVPPPDWPLPAATATDPDWVAVQQSPLNLLEVPVLTGCPAPVRVRTMSALEAEATAQLACIQARALL